MSLTDVADQWAQFAVAGPRSRDVLAALLPRLDLSERGLPLHGGRRSVSIAGHRRARCSASRSPANSPTSWPCRRATRCSVWNALLEAGAPFGIAPYGLDALNTLRIEKGHVTAAELNGNTSAHDLGFGRMLKKQGDFIGRALSRRPGMLAGERLQLVGVRPLDPAQRLRNGTQLVHAACRAREPRLHHLLHVRRSSLRAGWGSRCSPSGRQRIGAATDRASPRCTASAPRCADREPAHARSGERPCPRLTPPPPTLGRALRARGRASRTSSSSPTTAARGGGLAQRRGAQAAQCFRDCGGWRVTPGELTLCVRPDRWLLLAAPASRRRRSRAALAPALRRQSPAARRPVLGTRRASCSRGPRHADGARHAAAGSISMRQSFATRPRRRHHHGAGAVIARSAAGRNAAADAFDHRAAFQRVAGSGAAPCGHAPCRRVLCRCVRRTIP